MKGLLPDMLSVFWLDVGFGPSARCSLYSCKVPQQRAQWVFFYIGIIPLCKNSCFTIFCKCDGLVLLAVMKLLSKLYKLAVEIHNDSWQSLAPPAPPQKKKNHFFCKEQIPS